MSIEVSVQRRGVILAIVMDCGRDTHAPIAVFGTQNTGWMDEARAEIERMVQEGKITPANFKSVDVVRPTPDRPFTVLYRGVAR